MYNLLIAIAVAVSLFAVITLGFGSAVAAVLPALMAGSIVFILAMRRHVGLIQAETAELPALLDPSTIKSEAEMRSRFAEVDKRLVDLKQRWGNWQFLLASQLDGQRGMLRYAQKDWDAAFPLLDAGKWRDANLHTALACIHWRRGQRDKAWPLLEEASRLAPKDPMIAVVHAVLDHEAERTPQALAVLTAALVEQPGNELVTSVRDDIANKRKIERKNFPQSWLQFFPEDAPLILGSSPGARHPAANTPMRGARGAPPEAPLPEKLNRAQRRAEERKK